MALKPIVHEIRIQNQVIFLDPPIESARQTWLRQLHDWLGKCCHDYTRGLVLMGRTFLGVVCRLRRIQSSRYEIGLQMQGNTASEVLYTSLVSSLISGAEVPAKAELFFIAYALHG
jgi:dynein heavy chain 1